jgi:hypothetical protein
VADPARESAHLEVPQLGYLLNCLAVPDRLLLLHVVDCPICRIALRQLLARCFAAPAPARAAGREYAHLFAGLAAEMEESVERVAAERQAAGAVVDELLTTPSGGRKARVRREARFRSLTVAHLLLERSSNAGAADPAETAGLALLGIYVLGRLDPEEEHRNGPADPARHGEKTVTVGAPAPRVPERREN